MSRWWMLSLIPGTLFAQVSYVPWGKTLNKGGTEIQGHARSWVSDSRFDSKGKETSYVNDEGFSYYEGEVGARYGATPQLQIGAGGVFRQNTATVPVGTGYQDVTSSGLQSVYGTVQYGFKPVERLHYALEAFMRYTPYTNSAWEGTDLTKDFVLGNDGNDYGAGFIVSYVHPSRNYFNVRLNYRRPSKDQSSEVFWAAEAALAWTYVALVAGAEGISSLNQDAYTKDPENKPPVNTGGSAIYNSINRQYLAPYVGANIALGKSWRIEGRYQQFMQARSYDTGSMFLLSLIRRTEPTGKLEADKRFKEYDLEASVKKVSAKKQFVIIDKGMAADVQKGQRFDFFFSDYLGGNVLLARGVVIQVNTSQAVVQLTTRYNTKHEIKEGTIARSMK